MVLLPVNIYSRIFRYGKQVAFRHRGVDFPYFFHVFRNFYKCLMYGIFRKKSILQHIQSYFHHKVPIGFIENRKLLFVFFGVDHHQIYHLLFPGLSMSHNEGSCSYCYKNVKIFQLQVYMFVLIVSFG